MILWFNFNAACSVNIVADWWMYLTKVSINYSWWMSTAPALTFMAASLQNWTPAKDEKDHGHRSLAHSNGSMQMTKKHQDSQLCLVSVLCTLVHSFLITGDTHKQLHHCLHAHVYSLRYIYIHIQYIHITHSEV